VTLTADDLYELLPAVHRIRDTERGSPLKALMAVLAGQGDQLALNVDELYDDWFIETCKEWVVPYIGDLLRVRRINIAAAGMSERSYVANTIGYRRRKGTVSILERLAYDVTGWRAKVVETFHLLGSTQNVNHLLLRSPRTPDLRDTSSLELINGPFQTAARSVEVRRIEPRRGRYNIPDVAVMLWRLQAYPVDGATARAVATPSDGRYAFNPLGLDEPLFNPPKTETALDHLVEEVDVPGPLRPRALRHDLDQDGDLRVYFAAGQEVLAVGPVGAPGDTPNWQPVDSLSICDLSNWQSPPAGRIAVDVKRGRLTLPAGQIPSEVCVRYSFAFSADVGAGPYDRFATVLTYLDPTPTWKVGVVRDDAVRQQAPDPSRVFATLADAVAEWNNLPAGNSGVICVMDSRTYTDQLPLITVPAGSRLTVLSATCHELLKSGGSPMVEPTGLMPVVVGDITVAGASAASGKAAGGLIFDGLFCVGGIMVAKGDLGRLRVSSATLTDGVRVAASTGSDAERNERLQIDVVDCLSGAIAVVGEIAGLTVGGSVIGGGGAVGIDAVTCDLDVETSTVFGTVAARTLNASNSIFTAALLVARLQAGCVRFSYVPAGGSAPNAFRCQPDLALAKTAPSDAAAVRARLTPMFVSERLGDPGYAQLSRSVAPELLTGADNGSEMGVFNKVLQPQREANLRAALDEYLRFGLEAGIFYVN
jgi:hypothetical protein